MFMAVSVNIKKIKKDINCMEIKSKFGFFRKFNLNYLDSAATTQVPDVVIRAVDQVLEFRGNPSRSSHAVALRSEEALEEARKNIGKFIGADSSEIAFSGNATGAVNLAVDSIAHLINPGDEIIVSIAEHNSNMLPYLKLVKLGARIRLVGLKDGVIDVEDIKKTLNKKTKIVAIGHCSNVLGNINDVAEIGKIIKRFNPDIFYIIDGTQAIAHLPVNVKEISADFYAFSSHKMYGSDGVGVLFVDKNIHHHQLPTQAGGGTVKNVAVTFGDEYDVISPEYHQSLVTLEGGTPNTSNIVGLSKAVNFIRSIGFEEIRKHELELLKYLLDGLKQIEEVKVFGPVGLEQKIGLVAFGLSGGYSVKELGDYLAKQKICVRYGSHCAFPLAEKIGQETLRISFGIYTQLEDIDHVLGEMKLFFDHKKGLIVNPNFELLRNKIYYKNTLVVNNAQVVIEKIKSAIYNPRETEVVVMGGHFLAIPDMQENKLWPSIKPLLPERLHGLLEEFGMTSFSLYTWELACKLVASLKSDGVSAKLVIIANDTTGINELRLSSANINNKTAEDYRDELLSQFAGKDGVPEDYLVIAKKYKLGKRDILKNGKDYFWRETILRGNFKQFIRKNKDYFAGVIDYTGVDDSIDLSINILDNQQIKTCSFQTFNSKTGGKFCIAELAEFMAELFGKAKEVNFDYVNTKVLNSKFNAKHKMIVTFSPAMCDNAVVRAGELYTKLFLQERGFGSFKFFNIPLGPNAERNLAIGTEIKYISDKDALEELDVETTPNFGGLWRLAAYKLVYNANAYADEIESLFNKINISKQSKILDTCVGPGFLATELLQKGYNVSTADISNDSVKPFKEVLKELGIKHEVVQSSWLDLPKYFKPESFDVLFNRGNTLIYADGGWHEKIKVNKERTLAAIEKTLKIYFDLLKKGGYLYVDKFRDSEIPDKKVVARLNIKDINEQKDVIFYVERKPAENIRVAQMLLRDKNGVEDGLLNMVYDLSEDEMEALIKKVGFSSVERLKLKEEKHFVVWLAKK